jgi:hypothetical protein
LLPRWSKVDERSTQRRSWGRRLQDFTAADSFGLKFRIGEMEGLKGFKLQVYVPMSGKMQRGKEKG